MREKQKKIIQWSSLALILLTGIIVWRVNYEIDFMMDDEWYSTLLYADTPIRNLGDIVHAQIWHYFNWGGRSMAHALLQMILLTGESWADILNTAMTFVLAWLICQAAGRVRMPYYFAALGMLFGLNANWKMSMFWEAGAANYLYMTGFILAFLLCYLKYEEKNLWGITVWILPLGLIAGWSNENMGPTVWILSLVVMLLRRREQKKIPVSGKYQLPRGKHSDDRGTGEFCPRRGDSGEHPGNTVEPLSALLQRGKRSIGISVSHVAAYGGCPCDMQGDFKRKNRKR